jgi:hypothetical protein
MSILQTPAGAVFAPNFEGKAPITEKLHPVDYTFNYKLKFRIKAPQRVM